MSWRLLTNLSLKEEVVDILINIKRVQERYMMEEGFDELERRLENHDYTHMMSDDYRVQRAGRSHAQRTQSLIDELKQIDEDKVREMVNKHKQDGGTQFEV